MSKKLSEQEKYAEQWESASDDLDSEWVEVPGSTTDAKVFKKDGMTFQNSTGGHSFGRSQACLTYASKCVPKYDPDKLHEYETLDMEYDTMTAMYDALITELDAEKQSTGDRTKESAQDTHIL